MSLSFAWALIRLLTSTPFQVIISIKRGGRSSGPAHLQSFKLEKWPFRVGWGGYFFFVICITPKITTANRLSSAITSNTVMLSPPLCRRLSRSPLDMISITYVINHVKPFCKVFVLVFTGTLGESVNGYINRLIKEDMEKAGK